LLEVGQETVSESAVRKKLARSSEKLSSWWRQTTGCEQDLVIKDRTVSKNG
jgi:hypothetical protein